MPARKFQVEKSTHKPRELTRKNVAAARPNRNINGPSRFPRKPRSISLSSGPDLADIPPYESPPSTPERRSEIHADSELHEETDSVEEEISTQDSADMKSEADSMKEEQSSQDNAPIKSEADSIKEEQSLQVRASIKCEQQPRQVVQHNRLPTFYSYDIEPRLLDLVKRYPAINPEYFQEILENRFKPVNISKLSNDFSNSCRSTKQQIRNGDCVRTVNVEADAAPEDVKELDDLISYFHVYITVLLKVTAELGLETALFVYCRHLVDLKEEGYTFESVRAFHFTFHKTRAILGIDDPIGWETVDRGLERQYLKR